MSLVLRAATAGDAATILRFVRELAEYERELEAVKVTEEELRAQLASEAPPFECLIAELSGKPAGFALYFQSYSTWRGRPGLYLEDLFVSPAFRGKGVGFALLRELARTARARGYARMEWSVLDWNEPAIRFYERIGARPMSAWTTYRIADEALAELAGG